MCWIRGQSLGRKYDAMWMAFACQISLSLRLYFCGFRVAKNLSSVPMQKYDTITYSAL